MDCAKIIGARISNPKVSVPKMQGFKKFNKPLPPLFAVVTTAGTGSECSQGAMISDPDKHEKFSYSIAAGDSVLCGGGCAVDAGAAAAYYSRHRDGRPNPCRRGLHRPVENRPFPTGRRKRR